MQVVNMLNRTWYHNSASFLREWDYNVFCPVIISDCQLLWKFSISDRRLIGQVTKAWCNTLFGSQVESRLEPYPLGHAVNALFSKCKTVAMRCFNSRRGNVEGCCTLSFTTSLLQLFWLLLLFFDWQKMSLFLKFLLHFSPLSVFFWVFFILNFN